MCSNICAKSLSHVRLFATLWTVTLQALLSMELSSKNAEMGCHALLQGTFLTQGSNLHLLCHLHCETVLMYMFLKFFIFVNCLDITSKIPPTMAL